MTLILLVAGTTLAASFFCSLFEAALYAVTPSQVELLKQRRQKGALRLERLRADVEEPIAAILSVNTVAHTVGAAWCGAMVANAYGDEAMGWFAGIFTLLVLVLTEIIPKSLGVRYAPRVAPRLAWPLQFMTWLVWPLARPTRAAMRWLTGGAAPKGPSEEEVLVFARLAERHGRVRGEEHTWVRNALTLDQVRAQDLMTPWDVVESMPASRTVGEAVQQLDQWVHSRLPIRESDDPDSACGVIFRREIVDAAIAGQRDRQLREFGCPLQAVPERMKAHELLRWFLRQRRHLVAVRDEQGRIQGIVTLEDVLESLLGEEIVDEHDQIVDLQAHSRGRATDAGSPGP